ncbi:MAG: hypothetical protein JWM44_820 [Bacilli bacterium]|nr:hypothetical protein [Bacilli bacterium]
MKTTKGRVEKLDQMSNLQKFGLTFTSSCRILKEDSEIN